MCGLFLNQENLTTIPKIAICFANYVCVRVTKKQPGPGESAQGLGMFRGISTVHHRKKKKKNRLKKAGDCEYSHENGTPGNMLEVFFFGFCPFTPIQASC